MSREAWGKWGAGDELGAFNLAGPEAVKLAATLVRSGAVLSLAQPLARQTPVPHHRAPISHFMDRDGGDYAAGARRPDGFQFSDDTMVLPLHSGTHVDALCHVWYDDELYNGFSGNTLRSTTGAQHCGVDKLRPLVTRGVLLDIAKLKGSSLSMGATISRGDLIASAKAAAVELRPGDAVLIRTGWLESVAGTRNPSFDTEPGIDLDAALWLAEAGVSLVGADNFAIEVMPSPDGSLFPVHKRLIRDYGIPLLEGVVLSELAAKGATEFLFVAAPLPIVGGTASPVTPIAVL